MRPDIVASIKNVYDKDSYLFHAQVSIDKAITLQLMLLLSSQAQRYRLEVYVPHVN